MWLSRRPHWHLENDMKEEEADAEFDDEDMDMDGALEAPRRSCRGWMFN